YGASAYGQDVAYGGAGGASWGGAGGAFGGAGGASWGGADLGARDYSSINYV
ncbi:unnamed protein product, partial [Didymodactylos carnosus]